MHTSPRGKLAVSVAEAAFATLGMGQWAQERKAVMASLFKRRKQYWVSYYLDGVHVRKSLRTDIERVARSKLKQLDYELAIGDLHLASRLPLPVILETFCRHLMATRTYKSYKNDFSRLRVIFGPICEALKIRPPGSPDRHRARPQPDKYAGKHIQGELLEDVTIQAINCFLAAREEQDGWSPKTANLARQTLHKLFAYAIKHNGFRSRDRRYPNPAAGVDRRREPAPQIRFLTLQRIDEQLEAVQGHPTIHAMVATYIYAGLRREAACWLTREDVDLSERLIRVRAKTIDGETWQPKTKRNRVVPISDALFAILSAYEPPHDCVWFFPSPKGLHWNPDNLSQDLAKLNKAHGLEWTTLDFRHTFGSQLAQKGESLYKIATLMGNSPEICRKHYAALIPEEMHDVVEFSRQEDPLPPDGGDDAKAMLRQILEKLGDQTPAGGEKPRLRIAASGNPA